MSKKAPTQEEIDQSWQKLLVQGHNGLRGMRRVFRHLPSPPRCKLCHNPFEGLGGKVVGVFGFKRSRKNPNLCSACCDGLPPGGAEIDVAVLFADVRGSTATGEKLGPVAYASMMNRFYRTATETLIQHDCVIDKLIGDEVMALFFRGVGGDNYSEQAVSAGVSLLTATGYGPGRQPWIEIGIGVHAGAAYVGNVGGDDVMDFTALGDTVNVAARLGSAAASGELLISEALHERTPALHAQTPLKTLELKGKSEPFAVRSVHV